MIYASLFRNWHYLLTIVGEREKRNAFSAQSKKLSGSKSNSAIESHLSAANSLKCSDPLVSLSWWSYSLSASLRLPPKSVNLSDSPCQWW